MLLMSRHLTEYNIVPAGAVVRINLAWEPSIDSLRAHLDVLTHRVFLDIPCGRTKPPCHQHAIDDILAVIRDYELIRYVGVSQVTGPEDVMSYVVKTPARVSVVPKIESREGCRNIVAIVAVLRTPRMIMIDHDDLFCDLVSLRDAPERLYSGHIQPVLAYCRAQNVKVLRTAGVVFADNCGVPRDARTSAKSSLADVCEAIAKALRESYCAQDGHYNPETHLELVVNHLRTRAKAMQGRVE